VLPDINGMEVLRELKSTRELRHIPVHIMSSKERDNTYHTAGAVGYYQKPVNDIDIQHAIENLMSVSEKYPKELLIVEDDNTQREAIQDLLGNGDELKITGVASQEEAIEEIDKKIYDAAIVDLGLKDGSGYDICKYIKLHNIALPVIIYTGRELTEDEERELRKYTDSIIVKTARSYERLSDEVSVFLHKMYHGKNESIAQPAPPRPLEDTGSLDGKKILIVDDDMKNVFVLASALENNGATIIDAQNGEAALEILQQEDNIDLVLMDIMMPVMDGYTAIREIRKDRRLKRLPIIALTAKALKGDRQKYIQAGADDYLSKPVDYDGLIRLAKAWIEKG
jgi:CheY-like chemotaxis protein